MVNLKIANVAAASKFLDRVPEISMISLSRLIDGGAAILALIIRNHNKVNLGVTINSPLVRTILRVWFISYVILARQNNPDETTPCAIIISNAPMSPQFVNDITPATRIPIWPTDE